MNILLVGCGAMGSALRQGWMNQEGHQLIVVDPYLVPGIDVYKEKSDLPQNFKPDVIIFAIKPQVAAEILPNYAMFVTSNVLFVSIMAGVSVASLKHYLGEEAMIIRSMPNLPATVGKGMAGAFSPVALSQPQLQLIEALFLAVGKIIWVNSEEHLNIVTAISGSGPAYFFRFVELLAQAAIKLGVSAEYAYELSHQTLIGAGALLEKSSKTAAELRGNVTSPGGTTAAALAVFDGENALGEVTEKAVLAAFTRAMELSQ